MEFTTPKYRWVSAWFCSHITLMMERIRQINDWTEKTEYKILFIRRKTLLILAGGFLEF